MLTERILSQKVIYCLILIIGIFTACRSIEKLKISRCLEMKVKMENDCRRQGYFEGGAELVMERL